MRAKYLSRDFRMRLDNGVVFYKGHPYYTSIGDNPTASLRPLENIGHVAHNVNVVDNPDLDISSPRLGYVNTKTNCYYLTRVPTRSYKQSLSTSSLDVHCPLSNSAAVNVNREALLLSKDGERMLLGQYPSLGEVLKTLHPEKILCRAFDRDIALSIDKLGIIRVHYKTDEVGYIPPGQNTVRIPSHDYSWVISTYLEGFGWDID